MMLKDMFKDASNVNKIKVQHMKKTEKLHPLKIPEGLWKGISIDIIGPLPKSNRKDIIVVIMDQFTK